MLYVVGHGERVTDVKELIHMTMEAGQSEVYRVGRMVTGGVDVAAGVKEAFCW
jgi:hypothetical protein